MSSTTSDFFTTEEREFLKKIWAERVDATRTSYKLFSTAGIGYVGDLIDISLESSERFFPPK